MRSMKIGETAASWDRAKVSLRPTACLLAVGELPSLEIHKNLKNQMKIPEPTARLLTVSKLPTLEILSNP